jgi:predicted nucleic acid-binding protein
VKISRKDIIRKKIEIRNNKVVYINNNSPKTQPKPKIYKPKLEKKEEPKTIPSKQVINEHISIVKKKNKANQKEQLKKPDLINKSKNRKPDLITETRNKRDRNINSISEKNKHRVVGNIDYYNRKYIKKKSVDYDVIIVIGSYNRYEKVNRLINQLYTQETKYKYKVILYNDGSNDDNYDNIPNDYI